MSQYAATTQVSVEKSRAEIETTVQRYGADGFVSGWEGNRAMVQFRCDERYVKFVMTLPARDDPAFSLYTQGKSTFRRPDGEILKRWEQACRQKWRALALMIKAKLEAVESGIVSFEQEFLPHILLPDGGTVYEHTKERVRIAYDQGTMQPLLPDYSGEDNAS